ncbi:MAG: endonuclease/exonuclease/phosphatase family protein [Candidatus Saccharibacteria bacterium]|nr:endonuclease/exonuclease/phosphatase family protein [Candidatus Saccharibacteria bacterium]
MSLETKYKIMTWNILAGPRDTERLPNIARIVRELGADIALLQEIPNEHHELAAQSFHKQGYTLKLNCDEKLPKSNVGIAYDPVVFSECPHGDAINVNFRAFSLDLIPAGRKFEQRERSYVSRNDSHEFESPLDFGNDILTVVSYHGYWGTFAQPQRLAEVLAIDKFAKNKGNAVILGGDFNAQPNEPAINYLHGGTIIDGGATYWAEAQELIAQVGGPKPFPTSLTRRGIASQRDSFDIYRTPERRIDYLFDFGYSYGRRYAFDGWLYDNMSHLTCELSDHAPIVAGILDEAISD